jgi:hypothetical protein
LTHDKYACHVVGVNLNFSSEQSPTGSRPASPAGRTFWILTILYPLTAVLVSQGVLRLDLPSWLGGLLAVVPLIPGVLWIRAMLRTMRGQLDELQWKLFMESVAFIPPGLLGLAVSVDILRHAGLFLDFKWTTGTLAIATAALFFAGGRVAGRRFQ